jgi:hypothetical protein
MMNYKFSRFDAEDLSRTETIWAATRSEARAELKKVIAGWSPPQPKKWWRSVRLPLDLMVEELEE